MPRRPLNQRLVKWAMKGYRRGYKYIVVFQNIKQDDYIPVFLHIKKDIDFHKTNPDYFNYYKITTLLGFDKNLDGDFSESSEWEGGYSVFHFQ